MRVRMLTSIASSDWAADAGDIVTIEAGLADRLIATGQAELVEETATVQAPELATMRPKRRKQRAVP